MVAVVVEHADGRLHPASLEAIAAAQTLGEPIAVIVPGAGVSAVAREVATLDVAHVVALEHEHLRVYTPDAMTSALAGWLSSDTPPALVVMAHTYQARDYVPRLAIRLDRPLVTDCTAIAQREGAFVFSRPMFLGKITADVVADGPHPHLATLQIGAWSRDDVRTSTNPAPIESVAAAMDAASIRQQPEPPFREAKQAIDLTQADRIVAVGGGIGDEARIALARDLAHALGAELAASRPICDAGWLPMDRQIGSSGQTVAPRLYVALGISGAIQHVVGMKGARTIVAVNKDPDAPIFEIADYGIVGDLFQVVPALIAALREG